MTSIVIAMIVIVAVAAVVVVYVAYPHRGERLPVVPALGDAMRKSVDALPTVAPEAVDQAGEADQAQRADETHQAGEADQATGSTEPRPVDVPAGRHLRA